ncbi:hypothetical protein PV682_18865 [Streptomyces niveiscabiei]|uniref:hypothetical protein n=1 Tax=Streptomyces niveiscabiei TaxID=164115 RepID=UPI0029A02BB3|nr:hypothetical protein [Streptomyces niveiscabiei]MDX3383512.1 hypothetical protein [Streptomyces niveiscabiei]
MLGPEVLAPLRRVRRDGPGELRADALSVLAAVGGEEALSDRDRAAVERLVRVKLPDDHPIPLDVCFNAWMAVPGGDRDGVAEVLGLWLRSRRGALRERRGWPLGLAGRRSREGRTALSPLLGGRR